MLVDVLGPLDGLVHLGVVETHVEPEHLTGVVGQAAFKAGGAPKRYNM